MLKNKYSSMLMSMSLLILEVEIFFLTIYIALDCTMSSSPLSQRNEIILINKFNYDGWFVAVNIYQVT